MSVFPFYQLGILSLYLRPAYSSLGFLVGLLTTFLLVGARILMEILNIITSCSTKR
ncbi:hypothetical protein [Sulfuracidifex metallicus]|uniref:hypothetical protein n=1 Tax=Sulfuracidifex metallicus TaxID=47303 RepID=UPI002276B9C4|nr:hypothetical protein [Sulfuracidifex metallicus]MCY0850290.1 hypothetical protein [Sulfuracidifex metallicus]